MRLEGLYDDESLHAPAETGTQPETCAAAVPHVRDRLAQISLTGEC